MSRPPVVVQRRRRLRLHIAVFRSGMKLQPRVNEFSRCGTRFRTFLFRVIFVTGFPASNCQIYCVNALTRKPRSHDFCCVFLKLRCLTPQHLQMQLQSRECFCFACDVALALLLMRLRFENVEKGRFENQV